MTALILCILCTVWLLLCFRYFKVYGINTLHAIVVNYLVCVATGLSTLESGYLANYTPGDTRWLWVSGLLGLMFVSSFYLIGLTAQRAGVTVASLANKMSMVIPVLMGLLVFKSTVKDFTVLNYAGIAIAFFAIVLSTYKKEEEDDTVPDHTMIPPPVNRSRVINMALLLPLTVFIMSGANETLINYANLKLLRNEDRELFPVALFATSAIAGLLIVTVNYFMNREAIHWKSVVGGIVLGVPNYFSIYFMVQALQAFNNDAAFFFPVLNISIIVLSSIFSVILFKERLSLINKAGILVAIAAIVMIAYQEIWSRIS